MRSRKLGPTGDGAGDGDGDGVADGSWDGLDEPGVGERIAAAQAATSVEIRPRRPPMRKRRRDSIDADGKARRAAVG
jgi:hypothetical protein